jgi:uncharacterized integral membrane protein
VKALRILQFILLLLVVVYLLLLHNANPQPAFLPFVPSLPTAVVVALALVLGWLVGWLPTKARLWLLKREKRQLEAELNKLRSGLGYRVDEPSAPVIPDRDPPLRGGTQSPRKP